MSLKKLAVFCSSSNSVDPVYIKHSEELGKIMAEQNISLVYGGGQVGLMGSLSKAVKANKGTTIGIIPKKLNIKGITSEIDDELIVSEDMTDRKAIIREKADAFLILPGGYGTLEEVLEVITLKQLKYHDKAIVFLNTEKFYDTFFRFVEELFDKKFNKDAFRNLYFITEDVQEAVSYLQNYQAPEIADKWKFELK